MVCSRICRLLRIRGQSISVYSSRGNGGSEIRDYRGTVYLFPELEIGKLSPDFRAFVDAMPDTITILTFACGLIGLAFLTGAIVSLWHVRLVQFSGRFVLAAALFALAASFAILTISIEGYRTFTHEDLAVTVDVQPVGSQQFEARLHFPDGLLHAGGG